MRVISMLGDVVRDVVNVDKGVKDKRQPYDKDDESEVFKHRTLQLVVKR